jgi:hypothetical protein
MQKISSNQTIANLVKSHSEVTEILYNLGFVEIVKPHMLNTVGRFMTIKQGCIMRKIDYLLVKETFKQHGFELEES